MLYRCCDLLENSYLCGISNNKYYQVTCTRLVVICLKIRTFVVSATTVEYISVSIDVLWFAWKFVPLWYQQQPVAFASLYLSSCDLLENSYLCGISNNTAIDAMVREKLWFAWKFVPLWYQQQHSVVRLEYQSSCDLLENSYLCGISNNVITLAVRWISVVICLKIRTFVVSATTESL